MSDISWQKSSFSTEDNDCIELSRSAGTLRMRESDVPQLVITTSPAKLRAFLLGVKAREFGHPM
ncbi:DUF397 domain-containing protein [Streptomyces griseocarneus]|nr:DUF397 domain-containing protein [Streptomyces griseocarneus]